MYKIMCECFSRIYGPQSNTDQQHRPADDMTGNVRTTNQITMYGWCKYSRKAKYLILGLEYWMTIVHQYANTLVF